MKYVVGILLCSFLPLLSQNKPFQESVDNTELIFGPDTRIIIHGSTNLNRFNCSYESDFEHQEVDLKGNPNDLMGNVLKQLELSLSGSAFDCGLEMMNQDMRDLLQVKKHPFIEFKVKDVRPLPDSEKINLQVYLTIAGITHSYWVPVTYRQINQDLKLQGVSQINLHDFNLEPPRKMLGMVVVRETVDIQFDLNIQLRSK